MADFGKRIEVDKEATVYFYEVPAREVDALLLFGATHPNGGGFFCPPQRQTQDSLDFVLDDVNKRTGVVFWSRELLRLLDKDRSGGVLKVSLYRVGDEKVAALVTTSVPILASLPGDAKVYGGALGQFQGVSSGYWTLAIKVEPVPLVHQAAVLNPRSGEPIVAAVREALEDTEQREVLDHYREDLPFAAVFMPPPDGFSPDQLATTPVNQGRVVLAVEQALSARDQPLAADGLYSATAARGEHGEPVLLVRYRPRGQTPLLIETIDSAKQLVPAAFRKPLHSVAHLPLPPGGKIVAVATATDPSVGALNLDEIIGPLDNDLGPGEEGLRVGADVRTYGTEALGWYQSFHNYDENTWGIVLHDWNILCLGWELCETVRRVNSAIRLAEAVEFVRHVVLEHERFHALVDAASVIQELVVGGGRYRRYNSRVYRKALYTIGADEESLANYQAWKQATSFLPVLIADKSLHAPVLEFLETLFLDSPRGYKDFQKGADPLYWRRFANDLFTGGRPDPHRQAPLEGLLHGHPGVLVESRDVPVYITLLSSLGDALSSRRRPRHHSVAPGRRVIVRLLDGTKIISRFKQQNDSFCVLEDGRFPWKDVVMFTAYKKTLGSPAR